MMKLEWLPDALEDLKRLHAFIQPHSVDAASRAIDTILEAAENLLEFPERGKPWEVEYGFRELLVTFGVNGYVIRYRLLEERIIIIRVWHSLEDR